MNRPNIRRHAAEPSPLLFDLKGTYGTAPAASTAARLAWDRYALSADTSAMAKCFPVALTRPGSSGESFASLSVTWIAVMMFVVVPTIAWAFTQPCSFISRPYLWSYQRRY